MDRVLAALTEKGFKPDDKMVTYYDENDNHNNLYVFHKPNRLSHQNELRVFVENQADEPLKFEIGSIEDISMFFDISYLERMRFFVDESTGMLNHSFPLLEKSQE